MACPRTTRRLCLCQDLDLPFIEVVSGGTSKPDRYTECSHGIMVNSGFLKRHGGTEAIPAIIGTISSKRHRREQSEFQLRDWVFSRSDTGASHPLVYCETCGWVPIPYDSCRSNCRCWTIFRPPTTPSSCLARPRIGFKTN
jgi:leucyl-tRNA synthetase